MSNSIQLSCSALSYLVHSLFQDKFTRGAYPLLYTSQELLTFPFSAAGYHISLSLWAELKISSILTCLSQCLGAKAGPFFAPTLAPSSDPTRPSASVPSASLTSTNTCRPPAPALKLNTDAFRLPFHEVSVADFLCFH